MIPSYINAKFLESVERCKFVRVEIHLLARGARMLCKLPADAEEGTAMRDGFRRRLGDVFAAHCPPGEAPRFAGNTKGLTGDVLSFALADPPKRQSTDREFVAARPGLAGAVHQEQGADETENGEGGVE
jgi:hypothetical protein